MKKAAKQSVILSITLLMLFTFILSVDVVCAQEETYNIEWVNHQVKVLHNGYILVNDTLKFSGQSPRTIKVGFPSKYSPYLVDYAAYDAADPSTRFSISAGASMNGRSDIFGFRIDFLQGSPQIFTVAYILSNELLRIDAQNASLHYLDFPTYPSLPVKALLCNATVVLPSNAKYVNGTVEALKYSKTDLEAFTCAPGNLTFAYTGDEIQLFTVKELRREISIGGTGMIRVSDTYRITNLSPKRISAVLVTVPTKAFDVVARDEFGRKESITELPGKTGHYRVNLILPVESGGSTIFMLTYALPKEHYLKEEESTLKLALPTFENLNLYVERFSLELILPEGARLEALNSASGEIEYTLDRSIFEDSLSFTEDGLSFLDNFQVEIAYHYNVLWLAFRPTLWVWVTAMVGCVIVAVAKRKPKAAAPAVISTVAAPVTRNTIREFLELYDERQRIASDINALEEAVRRGRIPRRKYKVQRKTLDVRLNSIVGSLEELKRKIWAAGGVYAELMRQLDAAEAEIEEVKAAIRRISTRHRRGELSLEAYRKLLDEYQHRVADAEARVSGILVRLREELP
ncbi:hypothetical protein H5T51_02715 [Candidatus Bathyarchaeota archaeon]|nr:hypothetical protein [Candidatus Bathyarchaeota archaeon]